VRFQQRLDARPDPLTAGRKFEDVVKSARDAAVLLLAY
jgi:hypothetical protein